MAGSDQEPPQSLQAQLHPASQPQPGRSGRSPHAALRAPERPLPELAARRRHLCPPGIYDVGDGRSGDLQPGSAVGAEVSDRRTADETPCQSDPSVSVKLEFMWPLPIKGRHKHVFMHSGRALQVSRSVFGLSVSALCLLKIISSSNFD